jgi:hypothetical protein
MLTPLQASNRSGELRLVVGKEIRIDLARHRPLFACEFPEEHPRTAEDLEEYTGYVAVVLGGSCILAEVSCGVVIETNETQRGWGRDLKCS